MYDPNALHWTYEDYRRLTDEGDYFEIIEGERVVNPPPTTWHQFASSNLELMLMLFLGKGKLGVMLHAPFDVIFADDTVLQPDIVVISRERASRIQKAGVFGAPDLVIEILSPSTASRDRADKLDVYARHGVREYWLVDPEIKRIEIFVLEDEQLIRKAGHDSGEARSLAVLPGFAAPLADVFARP